MSAPYDPNAGYQGGFQSGYQSGGYPQSGQWGQPGEYPQSGQWGQPAPTPQWGQPQRPSGRGKLIAASAAAIVVIGGGVTTYVALSAGGSDDGAANAQDAVKSLVTDIDNDDLVGVLQSLPRNERDAVTKPFLDTVDQLKRNKVLRSDANLSKVNGIDVSATDIRYGSTPIKINDHVQVVEITGGRLSFDGDARKLPLTSEFLRAIGGISGDSTTRDSVDLADVARREGRPVRIAAQKVGDSWYPSLFYTVADNAAASQGKSAPSAADRIPDEGKSSADDAVRAAVDALLKGDIQGAIAVTSPDELGALHDYGRLIAETTGYGAPNVRVKSLTLDDSSAGGGGTLVSLRSLTLSTPHGEFSASVDGDCVRVSQRGDQRRICPADAIKQLTSVGRTLTPKQAGAVTRAFGSLAKTGVIATQTSGKWYINPVRSYGSVTARALSNLQDDDLLTLVGIFRD